MTRRSSMRSAAYALAASLLLGTATRVAGFATTLSGPKNGAGVIEPGTPGSTLLTLQPWLTGYDPLAICGDGSPAGYYYSPGTGDAETFIVYLEGGWWCWDKQSCDERYQAGPFTMSSKNWGQDTAQVGLLGSGTDNPFKDAHKVFVKYCSSDAWFGDAGPGTDTFGYAFRGARIVSAVMTALVEAHGLSSGDRVLLSGCSAGGRGVLMNLDHFAQQAPQGVTVHGFADAALWVDVEPPVPSMMSLQSMSQLLYGFTMPESDGRIPEDCLQDHQGSDAWLCIWPSVRLNYIQTPYFLNAAQFDAFQIMYDTDNLNSQYCCTDQQEEQWADSMQSATLAALSKVQNDAGVFSSTCLIHCLSGSTEFSTFKVNGVTLSETLGSWYYNSEPVRTISPCSGWDCTEQCSGGPWQPSNKPCPTNTNECVHDYLTTGGAPAPQSGQAVWQETQVASNIAAAQAAGNAAWSIQKAQYKAQHSANQPPMTQAQEQQAANQAWAEQQAASKHAAAVAAGNAAWAVQEANAKQAGGGAAWALTHGGGAASSAGGSNQNANGNQAWSQNQLQTQQQQMQNQGNQQLTQMQWQTQQEQLQQQQGR